MAKFLSFLATCAMSLFGMWVIQRYTLPKLGMRVWTFGEVSILWGLLMAWRVGVKVCAAAAIGDD
jgi:hypothetical protein